MRRKYLLKTFLLSILGAALIIPTYGCKSKDKEIVVAENMKEDLKSTKSEIMKLIEEGNTFLESGKFPEARTSYEKAISKDKANENIYLDIKDTYMKAKRFDDAYYIIKLAIDNNVSKDSMTKILEEIKSNFSIIQLEDTINEGDDYSLPNPKTIPVDAIPSPVNIQWKEKNVDTSKPGVFTFDGYIDEYGRTVQLKLTIKEVVKQNSGVQKTDNEGENSSNKVTNEQQGAEKSANNVVTIYKSQGLGLEFDIPASWENNYLIKDDGKEIRVYIKNKGNDNGYGFIFLITNDLSEAEYYDTIAEEKIKTINGKQYLIGGPTGVGLPENDPEFNSYIAMRKDVVNIAKSLRAV